jgi:hypothetical protein
MFIHSVHTKRVKESNFQLSCNYPLILFRHLFYVRIYTLTPPPPLIAGEGREGRGKKHDYLISPNSISIQNTLMTKYLPYSNLLHALQVRQDIINSNPNFFCHENK